MWKWYLLYEAIQSLKKLIFIYKLGSKNIAQKLLQSFLLTAVKLCGSRKTESIFVLSQPAI